MHQETGKTTESPAEWPEAVDFFKPFREMPANEVEELPKRRVEGKNVIGFRGKEKEKDGTWTRTFWIDPNTRLPVEMVIDFQSTESDLVSARWVLNHFVFDRDIEDAVFSTEIPEGYSPQDGKVFWHQARLNETLSGGVTATTGHRLHPPSARFANELASLFVLARKLVPPTCSIVPPSDAVLFLNTAMSSSLPCWRTVARVVAHADSIRPVPSTCGGEIARFSLAKSGSRPRRKITPRSQHHRLVANSDVRRARF